jgi:hypothetical protein
MAIQVGRVKGDLVELIYHPKESDLRVGDTLLLGERDGERGLIVQVIEFRTATYPSLIQEQLRLALEEAPEAALALFTSLMGHPEEMRNLNVAMAKIRKLTGPRWEGWDGWIPPRDVAIEPVPHRDLMNHCVPSFGHSLHLGETAHGEPFAIDGRALEKVNVIVGAKGSGKSYLAKVLLLELVKQGAPCVVFDLNREYGHLPPHRPGRPGVIPLQAGGDLRMDLGEFGLEPFLTLVRQFGLPEVSAIHLEQRLRRLLHEAEERKRQGHKPPFIGIRELLKLADMGEFSDSEPVNAAIKSRLRAVWGTGLIASQPEDVVSLSREYERIKGGGALVIDISGLSHVARSAFVQSAVEILRRICERELEGTGKFPFAFFEEAHLYIPKNTIGYLVTRARHLGLTTFFITNMITGLDEAILRQVDNLFVLRTPFEDDVRHLGRCALVDAETLQALVARLRDFHALVVGNATQGYPLIVRVKSLPGIRTAGETRYFFSQKAEPVPLPL